MTPTGRQATEEQTTTATKRRGVIVLPPRVDVVLRIGARVILVAAILVFALFMLAGNLPEDPEGGAFTDAVLIPLQLALLMCTAIGLVISFRSMAIAAAVVALGGTGVAVISALQYEAPVPLLVAVAFLVPAVMMWLDWQCRETLGKIAVLAVGTATLLGVAWIGSSNVYAHFLGPTHPDSVATGLPDSLVRWTWSGAVDPEGFTVTAMLRRPAEDLELVVTNPAGDEVARSATIDARDADAPVRITIDGLEPATEYRYVFESAGVADDVRVGTVATFPDGPASLTLAFGSCARSGSNGAVFDTIRASEPDVYVALGDLHYRNIAEDDPSRFASAYDEVHDSPGQSALFRSVPIAYVWDDHDFGANDSDSSSPSRPAAWQSYREYVPHYELAEPITGSINQAFTIGRVRMIMLDTRSHRVASEGTLLGDEQLGWLTDELLGARDTHAVTVIVSPTVWIGPEEPGADHWGGYAAERDRIGAFLAEHGIDNVVLVGGDAHMVALDDGSNSGYGGHDGFPVLQVAALDRRGSIKGGPHSGGEFPGGGQFGLIEVIDDGGDTIEVDLIGLDWRGTVLTNLRTSFDVR
ncbi:alkaline phosphatase D family protein [Ilumatobacter sp.]|uniref:alkaline phosphatase D family protein n=1 Tax=Ilumatobacter sp. TaxID=1967498 RepID=UPI003AF8C62A